MVNETEKNRLKKVEELIATQTNVKKVEYLEDTSGILVKKIKPNFKKLGAQYGPKLKALTLLITALNQTEIERFEHLGLHEVDLEGDMIRLTLEDVEISSQDIPGWLVASEDGLTVALDINLTEALKKEGLSRDVVNRVQNLRKDQGLEVQDKIEVVFWTQNIQMQEAISDNMEYIMRETQAIKINESISELEGQLLDIDGTTLIIQLKVATNEK